MKILIAEDDAISQSLLDTVLRKWGYEVVVAHDGNQAWEELQKEDAPRLAILEWMIPGLDGVEVCGKVRERTGAPYVYILLLSAKTERDDLVKGLESGADDYLTKPFDINELKVRLRAGRRILDLQTQLMSAQEALREQASRDPLTGVRNRNAIFDIFRRQLARASREKSRLSILMLDIDHFKNLNDTQGHMAGDAVLRQFATRITGSLRPYDDIGRYGGEEFLVLLPGCDLTSAVRHGERLRLLIAGEPFDTSGGRHPVTCSLGVASTGPVEPMDMDSLIRAADTALYQAKRNGRNRIEVLQTVNKGAKSVLDPHLAKGEPAA
jgi:diguanylate cyclase (GGDEF)-like protein